MLIFVKFFLIIFWASPLGNDKKTKSNLSQLIDFKDDIFGNFF